MCAVGIAMMLSTSAMAQERIATDARTSMRAMDVRALLARPVTVDLDRATVRQAISAVAKSAHVRVQYLGSALDTVRMTVSLRAKNMLLGEALERVLHGTGLQAVPLRDDLITIKSGNERSAVIEGGISGHVREVKTGKPVSGAKVSIDGTAFAALTTQDGTFRLTGMPAGNYTLTVRRLGYTLARQPVSVADNGVATADMILAPVAAPLQEVVTTVTGQQRRAELGNVVGMIRADSLVKAAPIMTISQLLSARVPGLVVSQGQGTVGGNVHLQIRGLSTLYAGISPEPIVIIDGIRYTSRAVRGGERGDGLEAVSPLNDLNPNDIETVEVVKGPSAATLYGTDAANGVIVITTKRPEAGSAKWNVHAVSTRSAIPGPNEDRVWLGWWRNGTRNSCILALVVLNICHQDSVTSAPKWLSQKEFSLFQAATGQSYGASVTGGQQTLRYYLSANFDDATGAVGLPPAIAKTVAAARGIQRLPKEVLRPNAQTLLNLRSNMSIAIGSKVDVTVSGGYVNGDTRSTSATSFAYNVLSTSFTTDSATRTIYLRYAADEFARTATEANQRWIGSVNGQGRFGEWLTTRAVVGVDVAQRNLSVLWPRDSTRNIFSEAKGYAAEERTKNFGTSTDFGATAAMRRGPVNFRTSIGSQYVRTLFDVLNTTARDLQIGGTSINSGANVNSRMDYAESVTLGSYVEQLVGLNDRLFLTAALRADGASSFGAGYKAVAYPKVSASWLLSKEPFMPRLPGVGDLRVRAAVGASGRQPDPTAALPQYLIVPENSDQQVPRHISLYSLGNSMLRAERVREFESGVDVDALEQRLQFEATWYRRRSTDLLVHHDLGSGLGSAFTNLGLVTGRGFEARVSATLLDTRPVYAHVNVQHSQNSTLLNRLGDNNLDSRFVQGSRAEGYPLGARFGAQGYTYSDANHDGIIAASEIHFDTTVRYLGNTEPTRFQTMNITIGLLQRQLRFSALFNRQAGGTLYDNFSCRTRCRGAVDPTSTLAEQAHAQARTISTPTFQGGYRDVESSNLTRLQEITATLALPARITRPLRMSSGSVSLSARNLAIWTRYSGPNPESTGTSGTPTSLFIDYPQGLPQPRVWSLRCDFGL